MTVPYSLTLRQTQMAGWHMSRKRETEKYLECSWEEFENSIKGTIESEFNGRVRPVDSPEKHSMMASVISDDMKRNGGVFPEGNAFIQRPIGGLTSALYENRTNFATTRRLSGWKIGHRLKKGASKNNHCSTARRGHGIPS